jgi:pimeloyl-ACP methyl ester carboxylesterase
MPYADLAGARCFYTDDGDGPHALLLVHQLSGDSHDWSWLLPLLRPHHRVVALDLRGHGHSSAPGAYALDDYVADLAALADHLDLERVVPVGHSLGAAIAAVLAVEHPERVEAVVEIEPAYALGARHVALWQEFRARWEARAPGDDDLTAHRLAPPPSPATPAFVDTWRHRAIQAMDPEVFWATFDGLARGPRSLFAAGPDTDAYLRRRACPVLSFHIHAGRAAWESSLCTDLLSHAVEWEGSGHNLPVERAPELAAVLLPWLAGLPA